MSTMIINLFLQAIAGAIGGNAAAAGLDKADLGRAANTIAGAIGGVGAGQIVPALLPTLAAAASGVDIKTRRGSARRRWRGRCRDHGHRRHDQEPGGQVLAGGSR